MRGVDFVVGRQHGAELVGKHAAAHVGIDAVAVAAAHARGLDRRAVGGEARYFDPVKSLLSYVDYDISYGQLNTLLLLGNWTLRVVDAAVTRETGVGVVSVRLALEMPRREGR